MRRIVHIGANSTSLPELEDLLPEEQHICFDPVYAQLEGLDSSWGSSFQGGMKAIEKVCALKERGVIFRPLVFPIPKHNYPSFGALALPHYPVDEFRIHNVFNESGYYSRPDILPEALCLLKPEGSIYVGANQTPKFCHYNEFGNDLREFNADLEVLVDVKEKRDLADAERGLVRKYMGKYNSEIMVPWGEGSYLVRIFKKR